MSIRHSFTVAEWREMAETDAFGERARMELLDGEVFDMSPTGSPHAACVSRLNHYLTTRLGQDAIVAIERPVELDELSMPVPDLMLLRYRRDFYDSAHPGPSDVILLVEVADTSLAHDLDRKGPLYARTGVSEYWIVDLNSAAVVVMRDPGPSGYRSTERHGRGGSARIEALPHLEVAVADLLAPVD